MARTVDFPFFSELRTAIVHKSEKIGLVGKNVPERGIKPAEWVLTMTMEDVAIAPPTRSRSRRWAVPLLAAAVSFGVLGGLPQMASADEHPNLPTISAQDLLVKAETAHVNAWSGEISTEANLGLPDLGTNDYANGTSAMSFLTGTHTIRIWTADPQHVKVQLPSQWSESSVIRNGNDLWTWQSQGQKVTHVTLPAAPSSGEYHAANMPDMPMANMSKASMAQPSSSADANTMTPQSMAQQFLTSVDPTTQVTVGQTASVAGRSAYELTLVPKSSTTLVSEVRIDVDSATGMVLRVQVLAKGQTKPAFDIHFTSVDFSTPAASTFAFTPPSSATVKNEALPTGHDMQRPKMADKSDANGHAMPTVIGTGWNTVVVTPPMSLDQTLDQTQNQAPGQTKAHGKRQDRKAGKASPVGSLQTVLKDSTPVQGAFGSGHLLHTALVNVVVLSDGRIAVGSVDQATLLAAIPAP